MQTKKISVKVLLIISAVVLMFTNVWTYVLLLSKNIEWETALIEKDTNAFVVAEALAEHVYYDGDSIPFKQMVKHYSRFGKMLGSDNLSEVLRGDKVVMLLSSNCCSTCASTEITKLLDLAKKIGRDRLVVIADYAMHTQSTLSMSVDEKGYFETDVEHLGLKGSPTRETAVVMLTQNGRVKTSFIVQPQTSGFADGFHEYLIDYFKRKK